MSPHYRYETSKPKFGFTANDSVLCRRLTGIYVFNTKNIGRAYGASLALIYATLVTLAVWGFWHTMPAMVGLLLFIGLSIGFYLAGIWVFTERIPELNRKLPISSTEVRRRRKEFFEWLNSQGPR